MELWKNVFYISKGGHVTRMALVAVVLEWNYGRISFISAKVDMYVTGMDPVAVVLELNYGRMSFLSAKVGM